MQVFAASNRGEWRQLAISPPLAVLQGDTFRTEGNILEQIRGGNVIATRTLDAAVSQPLILGGAPEADTLSTITFFKEKRMPGQNVSLTSVTEQATGVVIFMFSSGNSQEFSTWEDVGAEAATVDSNTTLAERILICKSYRASPDGSNKTTQQGAQVSVNGLADSPVVYTPPE